MSDRTASQKRKTAETQIEMAIDLGGGSSSIDVPDGFFAHMLDALSRHGGFGLDVTARGDTHIGLHHTVEDVGIVLGDCLREALGSGAGIVRFATAYAPLDEALARAVVDVSGRGFLACGLPEELATSWVTTSFPMTLVEDFFGALADRGRITLHIDVLTGRNPHHVAEATFKAVAVALRQAMAIRPGVADVPSTKGTLTE
ncbi:MAG: imidazoleglycerol-phosphate dehydratase HisB [Acidobacteriota bacterium]|nr:imidazoleglycerol-phosphate dehydratase HisB [Acidobacteriota bacterium]